jgi:heterodisulfide reductase subunit C
MVDAKSRERAPTLFDVIVGITPGDTHLEKCIQCGTCGGSCPSGADMEYTPRALFAMVNAGMKETVLKSNAQWYCVSCYYCMVRCPQEIHITDIMYSLKRLAIKEGFYQTTTRTKGASAFSETFIDYVENYGRSFELGLATRYHLMHHPLDLPKMAPMALGMFSKGRMSLMPKQIKNIDQLKKIIAKAKELEEEMYAELEV